MWAKDPQRRLDYYDATLPEERQPDSEILQGYAGAAGRVEGSVRVLHRPEEGAQLQPGEILVASTTNVGWTPLFPKAAAIGPVRKTLTGHQDNYTENRPFNVGIYSYEAGNSGKRRERSISTDTLV